MNNSKILKYGLYLINPFIILIGIYVIITGDLAPGGGFQGGVIIATGLLTKFFLSSNYRSNLNKLLKYEKLIILLLLLTSMASLYINGSAFRSFLYQVDSVLIKRIYFIIQNILIGIKVSLGFFIIFNAFIEEGT